MTTVPATVASPVQIGDVVYMAKHAATTGRVTRHVVDYVQSCSFVCVDRDSGTYTLGKDVFLDPESAITQAKSLNSRRIASLQKQLDSLKSLTFSAAS